MKPILRITLFALALLSFHIPLRAQPQITQAVHQPQIGDQVVYTHWENLSAPPTFNGANSNWNYTLVPSSQGIVDSVRYESVNPTLPPTPFPLSNIREAHRFNAPSLPYFISRNEYFLQDGQGMHFEGFEYVPGGLDNGPAVFDPPASRLRWPMGLGDTYADSVEGTFYGLAVLKFNNWTYLDVPGTGTLTINGTTYNDIICVHEYDSFPTPILKTFDESWTFYAANQRFPLMSIRFVEFDNTYTVFTRSNVVLGTPEPTPSTWAVFPNPIRDRLYIRTEPGTQLVRAEVYDVQGKWIGEMTPAARHDHWEIPAAEWKSGLYLIVAEDADGNRTLQKALKE